MTYIKMYVINKKLLQNPIINIKLRLLAVSTELLSSELHYRPANDTATDTEWQLPEVVLTQFVSPGVEHDVLETCKELKIEINT
jgi:hypothetical protein